MFDQVPVVTLILDIRCCSLLGSKGVQENNYWNLPGLEGPYGLKAQDPLNADYYQLIVHNKPGLQRHRVYQVSV